MEAFRSTLPKGCKNETSEKLTLCLNRISNFYTTRWDYALLFTLGMTILFYTLLCLSLGIYPSFSSDGVQYFYEEISVGLFEFFLITHPVDFMKDYGVAQYNGLAMFFDVFGRISISYGIYQFIQAFRKHGRR
jgi:hypothetical protein